MSNKSQVKITQADLILIYGDRVISNCRCVTCNTSYTSTIVNYDVFLNDLNDTILEGFCAKCGSRINRYLETGEVEKYQKAIHKVRKNSQKLPKLPGCCLSYTPGVYRSPRGV